MRCPLVIAVVERVVMFPLWCDAGQGRCLVGKAFLLVNNVRNITWGYVASVEQGRGGGRILGAWGSARV